MRKNIIASLSSAIRKRLYDSFDRTNAASIGTSFDGSTWNILRGSWSISSNKAVGNDANYPMATQSFPFSNQQISIVGTTGSAAALWVTDSGNWWAVGITQEPTDCNCTYYYNTTYYNYATNCGSGTYNGTWNASTCNGTWNATSCNSGTYTCNVYNGANCKGTGCVAYNGSNCNNYAYNATNKSTRCSGSYNASNCAANACTGGYNVSNCAGGTFVCNPGSTNLSTCNANFNTSTQNAGTENYVACNQVGSTLNGPYISCSTCYPQYIRILQSASGTVSLITSSVLSSLAAAFKVKTSGTQIIVSAYSDSSMITQIGSDLVYTPTGVTITPISGMTIIPSSNSQQYSIDSIEIKNN